MQDSTNREKVLKKIRSALINKRPAPSATVDFESNLYQVTDEAPEIAFASNLIRNGGHFIFCNDKLDFAGQLVSLCEEKKWKNLVCPDQEWGDFLKACDFPFVKSTTGFEQLEVAITTCECLVIRTGSIVISSRQAHGRRLPAVARNHVVIAHAGQLVPDLRDAFQLMKDQYGNRLPSMFSIISGPGKTADIELTPVTGIHGPEEVFVFLLESEDAAG